MESNVVLTMRGITMTFPGVKALDHVDLTLRKGEIMALMGENGAGKSTLIKCLTGINAFEAGEIHVEGIDGPVVNHSTLDAQKKGISTVYQEVNLCPNLSVAENLFIGIDEVSKSEEMIKFASEYGRWLRAGYPVYFVCTGLYENIQELSNVKNLTFFRRAATVKTEPLNMIRMTEMYKSKLDIDSNEAREMAKITKGYAYAFQELGVLYFKKKLDELLEDILPKLKAELFAYSYEKIWEEMTEMDRFLAGLLTEKEEYKREEVLKLMGEKSGSYSMYRDRLIKRGILNSRQGYISLALPYFGEYIKEYC